MWGDKIETTIEKPTDLCVPIYLDQQIVFDLLATLENGFSHVTTVNTSITDMKTKDSKVGASFGKSALSLFNISIGGDRSKTTTKTDNQQQAMEKIHSPSSMFSILRCTLYERNFVSPMNTMDEIYNLKCGDFVEFRAKLRTNPLMDSFNRMKEISKYLIKYSAEINKKENSENKTESVQERDQNRRKNKNPIQNNKTSAIVQENQANSTTQGNQNNVALFQWICELSDDLLNSNSTEIIGNICDKTQINANSTEIIGNICDKTQINVDLSAKVNCFVDNDTSLVMNGEFSVFGKVTQVIPYDSEDKINLLDKTNLRSFGEDVISTFTGAFDKVPNNAIVFPKVITEIKGPAIQVLPIAIFI